MTDTRPDSPLKKPALRIKPAADEHRDPIDSGPYPAATAPSTESVTAAVEPTLAPTEPVAEPPAMNEVAAAVDEALAPVAEVEAPTPAAVALRPRTRRQEVTIQLSARVSVETRDQLDDIAMRDSITIRAAIENAVAAYAKV